MENNEIPPRLGHVYYLNQEKDRNRREHMEVFTQFHFRDFKVIRIEPLKADTINKTTLPKHCWLDDMRFSQAQTYKLILEKIASNQDDRWYFMLEGKNAFLHKKYIQN